MLSIPRIKFINLVGSLLILLFAVVYLVPSVDREFIKTFSRLYTDAILLAFLLLAIAIKLYRSSDKFEPLFWYLIGAAFLSWFGLTIIRIIYWEQVSHANRSLLSNISYFLYYALVIAAIEIKSFYKAKSFLTQRTLITSLSVLSFLIGSFTYLTLVPNNTSVSTSLNYQNSFYFYILMDCYLIARWLHLSWQSKLENRRGFFIFGLASLSWLMADILEYSLLSSGEKLNNIWFDWVWYIPYILFFIGIQNFHGKKQPTIETDKLSRYHILNSPLFFLGLISALFLIENNSGVNATNSILMNIQLIWFLATLLLAILQIIELFNTNSQRKFDLKEMRSQNTSLVNQLEQSNRRLASQTNANQMILDTISNPIFTLNMNGQILSCNLATTHMLGFDEKQLVGGHFSKLIPKEEEFHHFFDYQSYRQQLARTNKGLELESSVLTKQDEKIAVHVSISRSKHLHDNLIISLADIRQQKNIEKQLHNLKDEFTANISHEFRTPLTIVSGVIDELLSSNKSQSEIKQLQTAKRNSLRLIHMVDQLLELSRVASEAILISDLDASEWVEPICQSYQTIAKERGIDYGFSICDPILIQGNKQAFENILYNLLSNAFKYTPKGGSINVLLEEKENHYQLVVADTGIGISKEAQAKVFDRFHRSDPEQHAIPGVGIGLSLVKDLTNSMNWEISLESSPQKGSKFIIQINKATAKIFSQQTLEKSLVNKDKVELLESEIINSKPASPVSRSKYLVLIIEDNIDMQRHLENILDPYHQCLVASNGQQGLSLANEYLPDIIVSDVMMPGMDGFEVLQQLKNQEISAHIPVILLTAKSDQQSKIKGLTAEADDYLTKPFNAEELILRIDNLLKMRKKMQIKYESQWRGFSKTQENPDAEEVENVFLTDLNKLFEKNFHDVNFSMHQLANELAMSERQLQRKIKSLVDISPLELLKRFRLDKSKEILKQDIQIGLVAQSCGFSSQTYFGRCFKEHFGITPKVYQQQQIKGQ